MQTQVIWRASLSILVMPQKEKEKKRENYLLLREQMKRKGEGFNLYNSCYFWEASINYLKHLNHHFLLTNWFSGLRTFFYINVLYFPCAVDMYYFCLCKMREQFSLCMEFMKLELPPVFFTNVCVQNAVIGFIVIFILLCAS